MVLYGPLWYCMVHYDPIWSTMVLYGPLGSLYGSLWHPMVPYGPLWSHMGSFPHPRHIFAAAQENKDLRSPCRGPSSLLTNIFCVDP